MKTTYVTQYEAFEWLVMPLGLANGPANFYTLMNYVFREYLTSLSMSTMSDDIVVYTNTLDKHLKHLELVFHKLREHHLFVKREKCPFVKVLALMGHIVGHGEGHIHPSMSGKLLRTCPSCDPF